MIKVVFKSIKLVQHHNDFASAMSAVEYYLNKKKEFNYYELLRESFNEVVDEIFNFPKKTP